MSVVFHGKVPVVNISAPPIAKVGYNFNVDTDRVYTAGEFIYGCLEVISTPKGLPEIYGLVIELEVHVLVKETAEEVGERQKRKLIGLRKYFWGNGLRKIGPLKPGEYKFSVQVPDDCPATFAKGEFGWIKCSLKCDVDIHQGPDGFHSLEPNLEIRIGARTACEWKNHKYLLQPMVAQRQVNLFFFAGRIHLWLTADQKCYQSGDEILFDLKVKNSGKKNVKGMMLQLIQIIRYASESFKKIEKIVLAEMAPGPGVPLGETLTWNASLKVPADLQPSTDEEHKKLPPISFRYALKAILIIGGSLVSNINEEFPIQIGCPLEKQVGEEFPRFQIIHRSRRNSNVLYPDDPMRRRSMSPSLRSLSPSLPDYCGGVFSGGSRRNSCNLLF